MKLIISKILIILLTITSFGLSQRSFLDNHYLDHYRLFRQGLFNFIRRSDDQYGYNWNLKRGKVQKPFPDNHRFFCDPNGPGGRSKIIPVSVHQLRPGDIDVIGAIGDSLTAGNGALATNILQVMVENRGVSWSIGGQSKWQKFLTLPNILKEFNPNLYGYSMSDGYSTHRNASMFNTAEIGAMSRDIPHEARTIIKRMMGDPLVKINKHWKMITILIGANDFCLDICYTPNPEKVIELHEQDLINTLRTLRDHLPRTIVNLVTPPNIKLLVEMLDKPLECQSMHHAECPCLFGFAHRKQRKLFYKIMAQWQLVVEKVADMVEFHDRIDFTVTNQPFLKNVQFPKKSNGNYDYTYMSVDCFHLSQKGYARASNALWNNMFEPYGQKSTNWKKEFTTFNCPTIQMPYIYTKRNS